MSPISNWCRCTSCHAGYGWEDADFDFSDPARIDCLVCHDTTGAYEKVPTGCGREKEGLNLLEIARNVGPPTRVNCGSCHWSGGGGDAVKHGDLDSTLKDPPRTHDVHMGGQDFRCQDCHVTMNHKIAGASTTSAVSEGRVSCVDCHDPEPHPRANPVLDTLNRHCDTVACQTCHIPRFAKAKPTLMFWDWSRAGMEMVSTPTDPYCISTQDKKKGLLIKRQDVAPVYAWYNGKHRRYLMGDPVDEKGATVLNPPLGDRSDPDARITPYKLFSGIQPVDAVHGHLIVPKLWGGFWTHFDWDQAARDGMAAAGLAYSGEIRFVETRMYWRINHEVVPAGEALSCTDCHSPQGTLDFKALGYGKDPSITGGRFSSKTGPRNGD